MSEKKKPKFNPILDDPITRAELVKRSHQFFFATYLAAYMTHETAPMHEEFFRVTEDRNLKLAVVSAFRGSSKSTILTISYPLWALMGIQQKKFILLIGSTQQAAKLMLKHIRDELESNELLKNDLGPFYEDSNEWGSASLVIPKYGARIMAVSRGTAIRGIKNRAHRPDLILIDDIEDMETVASKQSRDKMFQWFTGDILPLGELGTKTIVVGTPLHLDSLLMRLKEGIRSGSRSGEYLEFPIVDEANGNRILWPGLYPDLNAIETKKLEIGNETAFQREYMLKVLPGDDQLVSRESIQYYDEFPTEGFRGNLIAIDLAYSDSGTAHYTAMVALAAYGYGQNLRFYVYPNPINERISDPTVLIERIKNFSYAIGGNKYCNVLVEENLAHAFLVSQLQNSGITVTTVRPVGDKRNRFIGPAQAIQIGKVFFPRQGCEELINQLVYFPLEKYDDLLDAFSHGVNELNSKYNRPQPNIRVFESPIRGFRQI